MNNINFYTVIIGTELLNGRRGDKHFSFVNSELLKRGHEQKASFVITDEPEFMIDVYNLVKKDPNSVMFSFGGIGATPDDYTRAIASKVFREEPLVRNIEAKRIIEDRFQEKAYPHRIKMADLPPKCELIQNPISKVPGFGIDGRFFFVPGFPEMAHPMVNEILDTYFKIGREKYRRTITVDCAEDKLIELMESLPQMVELSSLPTLMIDNKRSTVLSLSSFNKDELEKWFKISLDFIDNLGVEYKDGDL